MSTELEVLKRQAAEYAVQWVQPGMVVGLGHGSTAIWATRRIGALLRAGALQEIRGIPASLAVEEEARRLGIPLTTLDEAPVVDVTIDGADEITPALDAIKGGGGALLREKILAQASRREVLVVDDSKWVPVLGTGWAVPVEVTRFGWSLQRRYLESLGAVVRLRLQPDGSPFLSNQGNLILDCAFGPIAQPDVLAAQIKGRTGIVEHGLFLGLVSDAVVAGPAGIRHHRRGASSVEPL